MFRVYILTAFASITAVCLIGLIWIHFGLPRLKIWMEKRAIKQRDRRLARWCMTPFYPSGPPTSTRSAFADRKGVMR